MKRRKYKVNLFLSLLLAFGGLGAVIATDTKPRLGLDLEGGVSVILAAEGEGVDEPGVLDKTVEVIRQRIDAIGVAEPEVTVAGTENILVQLPGLEDEEEALELIGTTAQLTFREVLKEFPANQADDKDTPEVTEETGSEVENEPVVYPVEDGNGALMKLGPARLTGDVITKAEAVVDTQTGANWSVSLEMDDQGADQWAEFTGEQACERDEGKDDRIAIVLDDQVVSAPGMSTGGGGSPGVECGEGISGGDSQIETGGQQEAKDLALVLRFGALPVELERQEVQTVSPTVGENSLDAGIKAGLLGLGLVLIYLVLYYRILGFVAWLGLAVFSSLLYVLMAVLGETAGLSLSLAGVAGVIVSVGVTADSYIVAFERVKDEAREGKSMRAAVERGMSRAYRTIVVADFVTGSAALILFFIAVGPVRGFALTLGLSTLLDLFIAYFFTRSAVHVLAGTRLFSSGRFLGMKKAMGAES